MKWWIWPEIQMKKAKRDIHTDIHTFIHMYLFTYILTTLVIWEAAKKVLFLVARPLRGGRGVRARPLGKKELLFYIFIYLSPKMEKYFLSKSLKAGPIKKKKMRLP